MALYRSAENIWDTISFSDFHGQKFSRQQEPGLREKITENMISDYSTDRVFSPILIIQNFPFRALK